METALDIFFTMANTHTTQDIPPPKEGLNS